MIFGKDYTELSDNILVYKNFISKTECENLYRYSELLEENQWNAQSRGDWFDNKMSDPTNELLFLYKRITDFLKPKYNILPSLNIRRLRKGENMYLHSDSPEKGDANYKDQYSTISHGIVVYFNDDYKGGEIYYPNKKIEYKPVAGDLVIHGSGKDCEHGVKEIIEGTRYCYSNFIIPVNNNSLFYAMLYKEYKIIEQKLKEI